MSLFRWLLFVVYLWRFSLSCERTCSVEHCVWRSWSPWSSCTQPCGNVGVQRRARSILRAAACGGRSCEGPSTQEQPCNRFCWDGGIPRAAGCSCHSDSFGRCCQSCEFTLFDVRNIRKSLIESMDIEN